MHFCCVSQLYSPGEYYLNDAQWHDVSILRYETNITFQIDSHFVRHFIPPDVGKLNIHFGIYIGGLGDFVSSISDFFMINSFLYYNRLQF